MSFWDLGSRVTRHGIFLHLGVYGWLEAIFSDRFSISASFKIRFRARGIFVEARFGPFSPFEFALRSQF